MRQATVQPYKFMKTSRMKTTLQATVQLHKRAKVPPTILNPLTAKSVALRKKDNKKITTVDGSQTFAMDKLSAKMLALFDRVDSGDDSEAGEHGDASIQPIAKMPAHRNENGFKGNEWSDDCDDEYHYDEYHYYNDRYDDDRYDNGHYDDDHYDSGRYDDGDDCFLYGGFTDNWEDYYDSVYN